MCARPCPGIRPSYRVPLNTHTLHLGFSEDEPGSSMIAHGVMRYRHRHSANRERLRCSQKLIKLLHLRRKILEKHPQNRVLLCWHCAHGQNSDSARGGERRAVPHERRGVMAGELSARWLTYAGCRQHRACLKNATLFLAAPAVARARGVASHRLPPRPRPRATSPAARWCTAQPL